MAYYMDLAIVPDNLHYRYGISRRSTKGI